MKNMPKVTLKLIILISLGLISTIFYLSWWFDSNRLSNPFLLAFFLFAVFYVITQMYFLWYIYFRAKRPAPGKTVDGLSVDVFIPTYDEPVALAAKSLSAALKMNYPHNTYLIDDGNKEAYRQLAEELGAIYICRKDNTNFKAGNINNAMKLTNSDFIAIFDVDHIPQPDFLDKAMGHFKDPNVAFVQVTLSHYNQSESFVARAAAERNDGFFHLPMLGLNGIECVQAFGSNSIFRRTALESIGGYQPGLAEDLHTSIKLHASGWKSAFVSQVLAKGLEPADLSSFFKQQIKWSNGIFEILWKIYPKLIARLDFKKNIGYLWRLTCFLAGIFVAIHLLLTIIFLLKSSKMAGIGFSDYLIRLFPFAVLSTAINHFFDKKNISTQNGMPWRGLLLAFGSWPIYVIAFFCSTFNIKIPFMSTPKEAKRDNFLKILIPQAMAVTLLIGGIIWQIGHGINLYNILIIGFALIQIGMHAGVFYAYFDSRKKRKLKKNHIAQKISAKLFR